MKIPIYQVDAFSGKLFSGNPAAVCPLQSWPADSLMQQIAMENNLAETAFFVKEGDIYHIRWFTPAVEVDLCGHATLAAAHVLFSEQGFAANEIVFTSRSGELRVSRNNDMLTLNFPADPAEAIALTPELTAGFNVLPLAAYKGKSDYMLVFASEMEILNLQPDMPALSRLPVRGIIVTAKGTACDFVSRFFAPQSGIDEDPVTGSAHTTLAPYWSQQLGKDTLSAIQLSARRGHLQCTIKSNRVFISGQACTYLTGTIEV